MKELKSKILNQENAQEEISIFWKAAVIFIALLTGILEGMSQLSIAYQSHLTSETYIRTTQPNKNLKINRPETFTF